MEISTRTRSMLVFAATAAGIVLFWQTPLLYPLKIFVVLLHESSHALAALATGGSVERIVIDPDQGGYTLVHGGNAFITLSAGYLGSLAWGAAILSTAHWKRAGLVAMALGAAVLVVTILYVRNVFGFGFGLLFGLAALVAGRRLPRRLVTWLLLVVGLSSCLYAVLDIKSDILDHPSMPSDARALAQLTHIPVMVWGVLWLAIALVVSWSVFRRAATRG